MQLNRLNTGTVIDLANIASQKINIVANPRPSSQTESIVFDLSGPKTIRRIESYSEFTLANANQHLDVGSDLPTGQYLLTVTPFSEKSGKGRAGDPWKIKFDVVKSEKAPLQQTSVKAEDDAFTLVVDREFSRDATFNVSKNDTLEGGDASFEIVDYPAHGEALMDQSGVVIYEPHDGFVGVDTFTYLASVSNSADKATASINVKAVTKPAGFTSVKASSDTRKIFVSAKSGKDSNDCLSESSPCKSIGGGLKKMRSGKPDHLYLKRGETWTGETLTSVQSGRSASEPAVVTFYGNDGDRPKIQSTDTLLHIFSSNPIKNVSFIGLHFYAYKMDPNVSGTTGSHDDHASLILLGGNENILFEDNKFDYNELVVQAYDGGTPKNIVLRRNIWTGNYSNKTSLTQLERPSNLYASGVKGLIIEENVFDHGGWNAKMKNAGGSQYSHNLYLQYTNDGTGVVVRNNIITRASSHGILGRPGGLFENNFLARNSIGLHMGHNQHPLRKGVKAQALNNVITEGESMVKGDRPCQGQNLCTTAVYGLATNEPGEGSFTVQGNIIHTLSKTTSWKSVFDGLSVFSMNLHAKTGGVVKDNIVWDFKSGQRTEGNFSEPGRTLADYNQSLGGEKDFDAFMKKVLNRPLQSWDSRYTADSINNYIRAGFGR